MFGTTRMSSDSAPSAQESVRPSIRDSVDSIIVNDIDHALLESNVMEYENLKLLEAESMI